MKIEKWNISLEEFLEQLDLNDMDKFLLFSEYEDDDEPLPRITS